MSTECGAGDLQNEWDGSSPKPAEGPALVVV